MKKFSIIIPAYNAENTIRSCIEDIRNYSYDLRKVELIIVNDGSVDSTQQIVEELMANEAIPNIKLINKVNGGVSTARNAGLKEASGEYILFLDSDDKLTSNSLSNLETFLNAHPVHLTVYNIEYRSNGKKHWRNEYLKKSGVFNANEFCYGALTTVNFCIRNRGSRNEYFDINLFMHEDEEFAARNALIEGRFGFCQEAVYLYDNTNESSATNTKLNPYFSFDQSMAAYLKLVDLSKKRFDKVCEYVQAVIINDFGWKLRSNVLFSESKRVRDTQIEKVKEILKYINPTLLLNHPNLDTFHKHYFLKLAGVEPKLYFSGQKIMFEVAGYREHVKQNEIFISRIRREGDLIRISGFYKTILTDYMNRGDFKIYALVGNQTIECKKRETYYSYHRCKTRTNNFIGFDLAFNIRSSLLSFFVVIKNHVYKINRFTFKDYADRCDLNVRLGNYSLHFNSAKAEFKLDKCSSFKLLRNMNKSNSLTKFLTAVALGLKSHRDISIYNDREGVFDNALYQFIYDIKSNDDVDRYYVFFTQDDKEVLLNKYCIPESRLLRNRSLKHQVLYLASSRIISSFVDSSFYQPIDQKRYKKYYSEWCSPEVIYLQHGVLHAKGLHYAAEYLNIDKVVISTTIEKQYYKELGFRADQLIETGASRYTKPRRKLNITGNIRKVLYLPSWRSYLADKHENNRWATNPTKFENSDLYKEIRKFGELMKSSDQDFEVVVQPHPILNTVSGLIEGCGLSIEKNADVSKFDLVITDYSSIVYDAAFAGIPIVYFCPDREPFDNGLNLYCEILTPMDDGFGPLSITAEELLKNLLWVRENFSEYEKMYHQKYDGLFLEFSSPLEGFYQKIYCSK